MRLLLDIGNTNLKWAIWGPAGYCGGGRLTQPVRELNSGIIENTFFDVGPPESILVSNVGGDEVMDGLSAATDSLWGLAPRIATTLKSGYGVTIAYDRSELLGVDRWLTLIAAHNSVATSTVVVDCGTALTLDAIDSHGRHMGGLIVPGMAMMWDALFSRTRMPAVAYQAYSGLLGQNTAQCVSAGALHSIVGLIENVHRQLSEHPGGHWKILLTGGGAAAVAEQLTLPTEQRPHLVLEGLALL